MRTLRVLFRAGCAHGVAKGVGETWRARCRNCRRGGGAFAWCLNAETALLTQCRSEFVRLAILDEKLTPFKGQNLGEHLPALNLLQRYDFLSYPQQNGAFFCFLLRFCRLLGGEMSQNAFRAPLPARVMSLQMQISSKKHLKYSKGVKKV